MLIPSKGIKQSSEGMLIRKKDMRILNEGMRIRNEDIEQSSEIMDYSKFTYRFCLKTNQSTHRKCHLEAPDNCVAKSRYRVFHQSGSFCLLLWHAEVLRLFKKISFKMRLKSIAYCTFFSSLK